jgi:hypothetical protein
MNETAAVNFYAKVVNPTMGPHPCGFCGVIIPGGEKCHYINGTINGEHFSGWQHLECIRKYADEHRPDGQIFIPFQILALVFPRR